VVSVNMVAVVVLGVLLLTVVGLTVLCIIVPLALTSSEVALRRTYPLLGFFAAIGLGFMFIEISQMQRLIVFLGHPTYALSVVLVSLLLSSGLGSYSTQGIRSNGLRRSALIRLLLLLGGVALFGVLTPYLIKTFAGSSTPLRIAISVSMLFPLGLLMGMAFPLGMKAASAESDRLTPWFWGINGATSVCASVLAVVVAMSFSISASFWTGFACYLAAFLAFATASLRRDKPQSSVLHQA